MKFKSLFKARLLLGILFAFSWAQSQAQFKLSAEIRPRTEFRNGFKTPSSKGFEPAIFTEQRSRIYFDYTDTKYKISHAGCKVLGRNSTNI